MKKVLFIDRDGTLIFEPADEQIDSFEKFRFLPGVINYLGRISRELEYQLVMVTNQDGLGSEAYPESTFQKIQSLLLQTLSGEGIEFDEILIDRTRAAENAATRKPGTGMLTHYLKGNYDLANSFVIGDRITDIELAKNLGSKAIFIAPNTNPDAELTTESWEEIYRFLKGTDRKAFVSRKTRETEIDLALNLDGKGVSAIDTGIPFFDHMLDQLARHGGIDLSLKAKGDLEVDFHHTIEDTALALGQAFTNALGSKKGLERYSFSLPMDESIAQVAIDFGGRPYLQWKVKFKGLEVGKIPTEMFEHFFESFCQTAKCNIHVKAKAKNDHHLIESIFKAWARTIKSALRRDDSGAIPSTKGSL